MDPRKLLEKYIVTHNYGVETADLEPLLSLFADDAIFEFEDPESVYLKGSR